MSATTASPPKTAFVPTARVAQLWTRFTQFALALATCAHAPVAGAVRHDGLPLGDSHLLRDVGLRCLSSLRAADHEQPSLHGGAFTSQLERW